MKCKICGLSDDEHPWDFLDAYDEPPDIDHWFVSED